MVEYDGSHTNSGGPHHPELVVFDRLHVVGRGSFFDDPLVRIRISRVGCAAAVPCIISIIQLDFYRLCFLNDST